MCVVAVGCCWCGDAVCVVLWCELVVVSCVFRVGFGLFASVVGLLLVVC